MTPLQTSGGVVLGADPGPAPFQAPVSRVT